MENENKVVETVETPAAAPVKEDRRPRGQKGDRRQGRPNRRPQEKQYMEQVIAINRVSKTVKGGRRLRFSALVAIGDGKGTIGFCTGKANEVPDAMRKALDAARNEIIKQQREEYNNGGNLEGEILSSGTEGKYFAPFAGNVSAPNNSSTTGGCSNRTPVYHDIYAAIGTPVYAPYDGVAKYIQSNCNGVLYSFGNQVRVFKDDGTYITYAHFSKYPEGINMPITKDCANKSSSGSQCGARYCASGMTSTKVAEVTVKKGQLIGYTGTTGNSLGPHLHVEIHEKGSSTCVTDPWAAFGMR